MLWFSRTFLALALIGLSALPASAGLILSLQSNSVSQDSAQVRVLARFPGGDDADLTNDAVTAMMLSVQGSDPLITTNGTDFSRFSFNLQLAGFLASPIVDQETGILGIFAEDPINGPFLTPSSTPYILGTLTIDLRGLAPASHPFVTIAEGVAPLQTDAIGILDGVSFDSFAAAGQVTFRDGTVNLVRSVPEPASLTILAIGASLVAAFGATRRLHGIGRTGHEFHPGDLPNQSSRSESD